MSVPEVKNRDSALDLLRVISAFFVIVGHTSSDYLYQLPTGNAEWTVALVFDYIAHLFVPFFFMISGRFMLDPERELPWRKLLKKTGRLALALVFWSLIYLGLVLLQEHADLAYLRENGGWLVKRFVTGEFHLWFLWAMIGLYLVTPILRLIVRSRTNAVWFLALFAVFQVVLPLLTELPKVGYLFASVRDSLKVNLVLGYTGYYVFGYVLSISSVKKRTVICACGIGALFFLNGAYAMARQSSIAGEPSLLEYLAHQNPFIIVPSCAMYLAATRAAQRRPSLGQGKTVRFLASNSFGIYLCHVLALRALQALKLVVWPVDIVSIPLVAAVIFSASLLLSWLIKKLPWLGKRIV